MATDQTRKTLREVVEGKRADEATDVEEVSPMVQGRVMYLVEGFLRACKLRDIDPCKEGMCVIITSGEREEMDQTEMRFCVSGRDNMAWFKEKTAIPMGGPDANYAFNLAVRAAQEWSIPGTLSVSKTENKATFVVDVDTLLACIGGKEVRQGKRARSK